MFHHIAHALRINDYLVSSAEFAYQERPNGAFMTQVRQPGFKRVGTSRPRYLKRSLPPLAFGYSVRSSSGLTYDQRPLQEVDQRESVMHFRP